MDLLTWECDDLFFSIKMVSSLEFTAESQVKHGSGNPFTADANGPQVRIRKQRIVKRMNGTVGLQFVKAAF